MYLRGRKDKILAGNFSKHQKNQQETASSSSVWQPTDGAPFAETGGYPPVSHTIYGITTVR